MHMLYTGAHILWLVALPESQEKVYQENWDWTNNKHIQNLFLLFVLHPQIPYTHTYNTTFSVYCIFIFKSVLVYKTDLLIIA